MMEGLNIWGLNVRENLLLVGHVFPIFILLFVFNVISYLYSLIKILNCGFSDTLFCFKLFINYEEDFIY